MVANTLAYYTKELIKFKRKGPEVRPEIASSYDVIGNDSETI
jgi:hypothetical protein